MIKNYFKIALRNLLRYKLYSLMNVLGLSIGLTVCMLIVMYVRDELSYDRFHSDFDRIYRVVNYLKLDANSNFAGTAPLLAPTLKNDFPQIEKAARLFRFSGNIRSSDRQFQEHNFFFGDADILKIISMTWKQGDPVSALSKPNAVILTESTARKYFGDENPMGQLLFVRDSISLSVAGVIRDLPKNSHLHFDFLASFETWKSMIPERQINTWRNNIYYTYIKLSDGESAAGLTSEFPAFVRKHIDPEGTMELKMQPITDIHLKSQLRHELGPGGSEQNIYVFSLIGLFILLLACVNYMNLATARASQRMKEIGLRKVVGASRMELLRQFLGESLLISVLAFLVSLGMTELVLPSFNTFTNKDLSLSWLLDPWMLTFAGLVVFSLGIIAGSYPALYLSGLAPSHSLKGHAGENGKRFSGVIRKALIVFQFATAVTLIIGTAIVYQQLRYVKNQNLGFDKEQIIVVPFLWDKLVQDRYETLKKELLSHSSILGVTATGDIPGRMSTHMSYQTESMNGDEAIGINLLTVDPDFLKTYQARILAGRDFYSDSRADWLTSFIINEAAVRQSGWSTPEEALGKRFRMNEDGRIIGVINDFNFNSLHETIEPLVLAIWPSWNGYVSIRIDMNRSAAAIEDIKSVWNSVVPTRPCEFFFLNDDLDRMYRADEQFSATVMLFAGLSIFIACLGLLALASFTAKQRTKEIGIRKVLGASVGGIVGLLSQEFLRLVLIANVVAWPVAYYAMNHWLENFAYRIDTSIWIFVGSGLAALMIALLTVSFQTIKAATANPVESLKYE